MYEQKLITDVGIDMDGVVYPFMNAFKKYCIDVLKRDNFPLPTKWEFYEDWGISSAKFNDMLHTAPISHRLFASESPMETVEQAWDILRNLNVKIHVITARPATAWSQTAQWLHDHKLVPDHLHFTHDKAILAHTAQGHSAAIDDHYVYQQQMEKAGVLSVLHTHPWNSSHDVSFRANSLVEFAELVKNVNNREIPWLSKNVSKYYVTQSD
jgi:hypothetical protein